MSISIDGIKRVKRSGDLGIQVPIKVRAEQFFPQKVYCPPIRQLAEWTWAIRGVGMMVVLALGGIFLIKQSAVAQTIDLYRLLQDGHYLVLFQNNTELRPTGGFLGSFALVDINNKQPANFKIETNIYNTDNQFKKEFYVPQPKPFEDWMPGNPWSLHDSNWQADFSGASQDMKWFYETEYQDKIDGIIAVNATVLQDLMGLAGPINLPQYQLVLDQSNILAQLQQEIDNDYFQDPYHLIENQPKTILAQLYPELMARLKNTNKLALYQFFIQKIAAKDILFNFSDSRQQIVSQNDWGGLIDQDSPNYLHINNANLGGGKSSLAIHQKAIYRLVNNSLELTIERINYPREDGYPTGTNNNYTRIYLPKGAKLISAYNLEEQSAVSVDQTLEFNRNTFGFWFNTGLNQTKTFKLIFELPPDTADQGLVIEKQPGAQNETLEVNINGIIKYQGALSKDLII